MTTTLASFDTIYYDASCGVCSAGVRRSKRLLEKRGFVFEPLQGEGVAQMLGLLDGEIPDEMKLRTRGGQILGGADALLCIARRIWWAWPAWLVLRVPGAMPVFRAGYRLFARNRRRISGACRPKT
jgi:predicted DCC family thiol-disulfide oxidoreductase YuxK